MTRRVDLLVQFDDVNGEEDGSIFWITPRSRRGLALVRDRVDWYLNNISPDRWEARGVCAETARDVLDIAAADGLRVVEEDV